MLATITAATLIGVEGHPVRVEVHVANGLPSFAIVGLPDASCREARDRVRAAVQSSGFAWPMTRITMNLAPSSTPKAGTALDLAMALGILVAGGELAADAVSGRGFLGELGLQGTVRSCRGIVPLVAGLRETTDRVVVSGAAHSEASLVPGIQVCSGATLREVVEALEGRSPWPDPPCAPPEVPSTEPDLAAIRGQAVAREVIEIAAAGGHHLLMSGPPGAGKTLLASRLPGLLPDLDDEGALEVTAIHSAAGERLAGRLLRRPPYRAPHHTASVVSVVGGGTAALRPGEISLAHRGVLFFDELGEFPPVVLNALRQPIEEGGVRISRARSTVSYPARFQFVAATNPCPCGPLPRGCRCSEGARLRYTRRLSGPLLDRIDLRIELQRPEPSELLRGEPGEPSAVVAERVRAARAVSAARGVAANADLSASLLEQHAPMTPGASRLLERMLRAGRLSGRGLHRVRRVARTIADLAGEDGLLQEDHVATALALRSPMASVDPAAS